MNGNESMPFDFDAVKDLLRCPGSRSPLVQRGDALICTDADCRLQFAVRDDIPILLLDEATQLSPDDWNTAIQQAGGTEENPPHAH